MQTHKDSPLSFILTQGRPLSASSHNPRSPGDTSSPRPPNNVYYRYIPVHIAPNPTSQPVYYQQQQAATAPPVSVCPA